MLKHLVLTGALVGTAALPLGAQQAASAAVPLLEISPYAGYMMFGDIVKGPLGTSLSTANGPVYGAQLGVNLTKNIALIGNVARAGADMQVGLPIIGGVSVGTSTAWLYDGGLQLSLPVSRATSLPIRPFVQVGAGAISYDVKTGPLSLNATNFAGNAGVGADVSLGSGFGLRLMAKDYIGKFDVKQATEIPVEGKLSHNFALSAGVTLSF